MLLLLAALTAPLLTPHAHAGMMATATLDAPVPVVADADLLPESGTWPCTLTLQVDSMGIVQTVGVDNDCPSGLTDTARDLGKGWHWRASGAARVEEVTVLFTVLGFEEAEPKAVSTPGKVVFLLRPLGILSAVGPAPVFKGKLVHPKLPRAAAAAGINAGTCLVRLDLTPEGKVTRARATRCVDVLAEAAVAGALKLKVEATRLSPAPKELDVALRFEPPEK